MNFLRIALTRRILVDEKLGILVEEKLAVCLLAAWTSKGILGCIRRGVVCRAREVTAPSALPS